MVKRADIESCVDIAKRYGANKIVLFGSAQFTPETAHDIDLICSGVPDALFYQMAADMEDVISVPVDVFSALPETSFVRFNLPRGKVIYER